ncbi:hypothetical protein [Maridesulfovibrio bastinii]|uniref:hypothetical protein n=1 Tax=Maridesulfovibrio bastinii TaxID=47157 RepID=UPI000483037F|nr:hypothetical protein [Maridesulfovibrio bastinii]
MKRIKFKSRNAAQLIEIGMTEDEVKELAGKPLTIIKSITTGWSYGDVWVNFQSGIVCAVYYSPAFHSEIEGNRIKIIQSLKGVIDDNGQLIR